MRQSVRQTAPQASFKQISAQASPNEEQLALIEFDTGRLVQLEDPADPLQSIRHRRLLPIDVHLAWALFTDVFFSSAAKEALAAKDVPRGALPQHVCQPCFYLGGIVALVFGTPKQTTINAVAGDCNIAVLAPRCVSTQRSRPAHARDCGRAQRDPRDPRRAQGGYASQTTCSLVSPG